jgi:hypothetical protein
MSPEPAGYSRKSLCAKLGIREGSRILALHSPADYLRWLEPLPLGVEFAEVLTKEVDLVHLFHDRRAELTAELEELRGSMRSDCILWVSWPKKSSGRPSEIDDNVIRELALPLGLVDVKVCAVSEVWSGLKLVIRKALR